MSTSRPLPLIAIVLWTPVAHAAPVPLVNASFEADFAADNTFPVGPVTGWQAYDPLNLLSQPGNFTGVLNPTGSTFFPSGAPDGRNVALLFLEGTIGQGPVGLSQTVPGLTLVTGTRYTLTVEVGNIASGTGSPPFDQFGFYDLDGFPGYSVQLLVNGVVLAEDFNTQAIAEGEFVTVEIEYVAPVNPLAGELEIRLINLNLEDTPEDPGIEVDFDLVRLDASPAGCNAADLVPPFGEPTFADISAFLASYANQNPAADLAAPFGSFTFADISAFLAAFSAGCP